MGCWDEHDREVNDYKAELQFISQKNQEIIDRLVLEHNQRTAHIAPERIVSVKVKFKRTGPTKVLAELWTEYDQMW